eukprot:m.254605 g.254605  ORF g.254605 m.254605 type:complete len:140 (-) comp18229_c0_seq1:53-472(-)
MLNEKTEKKYETIDERKEQKVRKRTNCGCTQKTVSQHLLLLEERRKLARLFAFADGTLSHLSDGHLVDDEGDGDAPQQALPRCLGCDLKVPDRRLPHGTPALDGGINAQTAHLDRLIGCLSVSEMEIVDRPVKWNGKIK